MVQFAGKLRGMKALIALLSRLLRCPLGLFAALPELATVRDWIELLPDAAQIANSHAAPQIQ